MNVLPKPSVPMHLQVYKPVGEVRHNQAKRQMDLGGSQVELESSQKEMENAHPACLLATNQELNHRRCMGGKTQLTLVKTACLGPKQPAAEMQSQNVGLLS